MPAHPNPTAPVPVVSPRKSRYRALAAGLALFSAGALADPPSVALPSHYSVPACRYLVGDAGRMIAWARWEQRMSVEKVRNAPVRSGVPEWVTVLLQGWIDDAYDWKPTNEQIYQWAAELGNTDHLPDAKSLTVHETIAIWLRRIARACHRDEV